MAKKLKVVAIIQARIGSTRLPGKILLPLNGKTVLEHVYDRVAASKLIDKVVIATTNSPKDDVVVELCKEKNIEVCRGSENDLLDRYYQAAVKYNADEVVRITSDCPLIDPKLIDRTIKQHFKERNDYTATAFILTFPDGEDVEIFTMAALTEAWQNAELSWQREHATQYITKTPGRFKIGNVAYKDNISNKRWTLDEEADYKFIRQIYEALGKKNPLFGIEDILKYLKNHPYLEKINESIINGEGLIKSMKEEKIIKSKIGQKLYVEAKKIIPGGTQLLSKRPEMHLPENWPSYYKKAKGCEVWDLDGNKFIDMSYMAIGACVLGYADDDVNAAVINSVNNGVATTLNSPLEVELTKLLLGLHPWAGMARYGCSGGEILAVAVRIARAKSGKDKILFCGYHGWHDWYLASNLADDKSLDGHLIPGLQPKGVPRALKGTSIPFGYNDTARFLELIKEHGNEVGVVVMEPLRNERPTKGFLETVREVTAKNNIILVIDEVSLGFRLTTGGAHLTLGLEPDIATFAKALGNGFPVAAVIGKKEIMDVAQESFISSTNWTGSVGLSAAISTITKFRENDVSTHLQAMGLSVKKGWQKAAKKHGLEIHISGTDAIAHFGFDYEEPLVLKTLFTQLMLEKGFLATTAFYASFAHKQNHVDMYLEATDEVFKVISKAIKDGHPKDLLIGGVAHSGFKRLA